MANKVNGEVTMIARLWRVIGRNGDIGGSSGDYIMTDVYRRLIESLEVLGSDPSYQRDYLEKLGVSPSTDEMALEFDDVYLTFKSNLSLLESDFEREFISKIDSLNVLFDEMSDNRPGLWTIDSLNDNEWSRVRDIANEALALQ